MSKTWLQSVALASVLVGWGCSSNNNNAAGGGSSKSSSTSAGSAGQTASSGGSTAASSTTSAGGGATTTPSGGKSSAGGTTSGGGATPSGGSSEEGGTTAAGGVTSAGGASGTGGAAGKTGSGGGTGATGGRTGSAAGTGAGGATGSGGATGTGGAAAGTTGGGGTVSSTGAVTVELDSTKQTIDGFGLNTALGGGTVPWDTLYTTTGSGLGFSIVRVGMTSSGGLSGSVPSASYNVKVIGSVWTAPSNCRTNVPSNGYGGHLSSSCYDSFSTTIATFAKNQKLYAMSAANEPDFQSCGSAMGPPCWQDYDTMLYTANEMVAFVKVLGPKLKTAGVKLIAPEASEWIHLWSNTSATGSTVSGHPNSSDPLKCGCFGNSPTTTGCASTCTSGGGYDYGHWLAKDATAWAAVDIIGTHEYDTQKAEPWPADVDGGKRTKPVYETEVSGVMYWPEQGFSSDINNGIAVAGWVHSALVVGEASAWLYWWYSPNSNASDNEGLVASGSSTLTKRAYTIGNYSKFVRPGYTRVDVGGSIPANVLLSAYTGTDGTVIVAINKGTAEATVPITISGGTAPASCTPNVTSATDNLKAGTAVAVTGGILSASLAASSVTTFVCK